MDRNVQEKSYLLEILDTGKAHAQENMRIDAELLGSLKDQPILHFYRWEGPSLTFGYFIRPEEWLDLQVVNSYHLQLAKRPTGGGSLFHIWDLAFSFLLPSSHPCFSLNTLENYRFVNQVVAYACGEIFPSFTIDLAPQDFSKDPTVTRFCMANPSRYDVIDQGKKIAGSSQRKTNRGYLHQGSISLAVPDFSWMEPLFLPSVRESVVARMKNFTFAPLQNPNLSLLEEARKQLEGSLFRHLEKHLSEGCKERYN